MQNAVLSVFLLSFTCGANAPSKGYRSKTMNKWLLTGPVWIGVYEKGSDRFIGYARGLKAFRGPNWSLIVQVTIKP